MGTELVDSVQEALNVSHPEFDAMVEDGTSLAKAIRGVQTEYVHLQSETFVRGTFREWLDGT